VKARENDKLLFFPRRPVHAFRFTVRVLSKQIQPSPHRVARIISEEDAKVHAKYLIA
jgi:hypothetical protein